ncbi:MBOAT, membrane-bound o-acyltransferase family domain-containing protein [Ditylenchus destructor]|nr:MBOAT, membrane-bound o-acyltransferase family domain-containing protein [Ditylenchus destructor]
MVCHESYTTSGMLPENVPLAAQQRKKKQSTELNSSPCGGKNCQFESSSNDRNKRKASHKIIFDYPALPEIKICFVITVCAVIYGWWCVYSVSKRYQFKIGSIATLNVLPYFGARFKDQSNWEWSRWAPFALSYLPFLLLHSVVFNLTEKLFPHNVWMSLNVVLSMGTSAYIFTPKLLICSLLQGTIIFLSTLCFRRTITVWLSAVPILYIVMNHSALLSQDVFLVLLFVSYTLLSYISFCLEWVRGRVPTDENGQQNTVQLACRMLFYTFYQPYLFSLIVLYPDFEQQLIERKIRARDWRETLFFAARVAFWWLVIELGLHFFYFEIILNDLRFAASLPKNEFVTLGMALGGFFHLKYVVIFGLPAVFAKLDNMQPPKGPMCISSVALYSKIWRGFDRGLYAFFKEYIFVPICTPTFSLWRKVTGVFVSYTFVLLWHGFLHQNIIWIVLNIVELFLEYVGKTLYTLQWIRDRREKSVSDTNFRRLLGVLQIVPFAFGLYSNFYFLGGSEIGWLFVKRIFLEETVTLRWPFFLLITIGYFYMQVAMEKDRRGSSCPVKLTTDRQGSQLKKKATRSN